MERASASRGATLFRQRRYALALFGLLLLALGIRLYHLVPPDVGLLYAQDADEGVYATTAQLALQGYLPYRDFFTPMPPMAIYLYMLVLRAFYQPWGSPAGLMALRYFSVACGVLAVFLTSWLARIVGGRRAGLLAGAVIAVDGIVVAQDRRAMLEAPTNLLSILAILCYLLAQREAERAVQPSVAQRRRCAWLAASGAFCTLALLVKGTALVPILVVGVVIVARRRWKEALPFGAALLVTYVLFAGVFLVLCPSEYIRQNYVFHLLRPWDGTAHPISRLMEMWSYPWSWLTVRVALVGIGATLLAWRRARGMYPLGVVILWAGLVLLLLLTSKTYWATYFSQLAVPLSILGGMLVSEDLLEGLAVAFKRLQVRLPFTVYQVQALLLIAILVLGYPGASIQVQTTRAALEQEKLVYPEMADAINRLVPAAATILVFEPNYTFLTSRPPAGARPGSFFVDSYGEMLYRNLDIPNLSAAEIITVWRTGERMSSRGVFHLPAAQAEVLRALDQAQYIVVDGRALKQLTPETADRITQASTVIHSAFASELRVRTVGDRAVDAPGVR